MHHQADFNFDGPPAPANPDELKRLLQYLHIHPGFHTAREISADLNLSDREVRALAAASAGIVISGPGSPGYCHIYHCPVKTLDHIANTLISQGKSMIRRGIQSRRAAHALIR